MAKPSRRRLQQGGNRNKRVRGRRVNLEAIEDRIDAVLAKKALREKGSIPWVEAKKELGLK